MVQPVTTTAVSKTKATLLWALLLLFFFQLTSVWMESIYRMALIKLEIGNEVYGMLFLFGPLILFLVPKRCERGLLWGVMGLLLTARVLFPLFGASARIVAAGLGAGAFLTVFCYALSDRYRALRGDMGVAVGLAVLLSVMFRSWRSSIDISMEGSTSILGWVLVLLALVLFRAVVRDVHDVHDVHDPSAMHHVPWWQRTVAVIGLFSHFTLIYLFLSSPAVVNAWCGGNRLGYTTAIAATVAAFAATLLWAVVNTRSPSRAALAGVTVCFLLLLAGGIARYAPVSPVSAAANAVFVRGNPLGAWFLLQFGLVCSPIVIFGIRHAWCLSGGIRPRDAVLPVVLGMAFLLAVTTLLIFTNVWGYIQYGRLFRNRFAWPLLLAGAGMLLPLMLRLKNAPPETSAGPFLGKLAAAAAVLAVAGTVWCGASRAVPRADTRQLTILTYNMQQGSQANGDRGYREQLALLRNVDADIIGLQESDTARPSGGNVDTVRYFADALGYYSYYGPGTVSGTFGTAILSRYPIRNPRTFFTYSDSDEVGTAAAEIDVDGTSITFFSNHPSGAGAVMNAHVDALIAEAGKSKRSIAVGDYNFSSREPYFAKLAALLVPCAATRGEARIGRYDDQPELASNIDHIFVSPGFHVLESHYLPPPGSRTDHPAHWAVVRIGD